VGVFLMVFTRVFQLQLSVTHDNSYIGGFRRKSQTDPVLDPQFLLGFRSTMYVKQCDCLKHYCLVSLMWMKISSNDITAQVPGVS
jgi:hypothetical protein